MLIELYVRNFAVIEEVRLRLGAGLTVISGEEGAGKSLLVDALGALLGERATTALVRTGAAAAVVEGVFALDSQGQEAARRVLAEAGLEVEDDGTLVLTREVQATGRSLGRVNGRAVPAGLLRSLGAHLVAVHGQMEHLALMEPQRQRDLLDAHGRLEPLRAQVAGLVAELHRLERTLAQEAGPDAVRQQAVLEEQVEEIEAAAPRPGEDEALQQEREVLSRAASLREGAQAAYTALDGDGPSAMPYLQRALAALRRVAAFDPALGALLERLQGGIAELEEVARDLRQYGDALDDASWRLGQVEERLEVLRRLMRKYGPTLADVVAFVQRGHEQLAALADAGQRREALEAQRQELAARLASAALELSHRRREAAQGLAELVRRSLADLGMPWATFDIAVSQESDPQGLPTPEGPFACSQYGIDRVEFIGATNPGEPLRPLGRIASGGETSRFMLALQGALREADPVPTLVFDEIDMGVGGRSAHLVGRKLADLAQHHQVLCITHLPQIAAFADTHYRVAKELTGGEARTTVHLLEGAARVEEIAAMLGSPESEAMGMSARELLARARHREEG